MNQSFTQTIALIKADMLARCLYENKQLHFLRVLRYFFYASTVPVILYRWQIFFYQHHMGLIASFLQFVSGIFFTVQIDSNTEIGPGFMIFHNSYIIVGPNVKIGKNCIMVHQNSVMPSIFYDPENNSSLKGPVLGDNVLLGGGACVVGNITLGNNIKISMNATVDESFPDDAVLFGVPAKNVAKKSEVRTNAHEVSA